MSVAAHNIALWAMSSFALRPLFKAGSRRVVNSFDYSLLCHQWAGEVACLQPASHMGAYAQVTERYRSSNTPSWSICRWLQGVYSARYTAISRWLVRVAPHLRDGSLSFDAGSGRWCAMKLSGSTLRSSGWLRRPLSFDVERPLAGVEFRKVKDSNRCKDAVQKRDVRSRLFTVFQCGPKQS